MSAIKKGKPTKGGKSRKESSNRIVINPRMLHELCVILDIRTEDEKSQLKRFMLKNVGNIKNFAINSRNNEDRNYFKYDLSKFITRMDALNDGDVINPKSFIKWDHVPDIEFKEPSRAKQLAKVVFVCNVVTAVTYAIALVLSHVHIENFHMDVGSIIVTPLALFTLSCNTRAHLHLRRAADSELEYVIIIPFWNTRENGLKEFFYGKLKKEDDVLEDDEGDGDDDDDVECGSDKDDDGFIGTPTSLTGGSLSSPTRSVEATTSIRSHPNEMQVPYILFVYVILVIPTLVVHLIYLDARFKVLHYIVTLLYWLSLFVCTAINVWMNIKDNHMLATNFGILREAYSPREHHENEGFRVSEFENATPMQCIALITMVIVRNRRLLTYIKKSLEWRTMLTLLPSVFVLGTMLYQCYSGGQDVEGFIFNMVGAVTVSLTALVLHVKQNYRIKRACELSLAKEVCTFVFGHLLDENLIYLVFTALVGYAFSLMQYVK